MGQLTSHAFTPQIGKPAGYVDQRHHHGTASFVPSPQKINGLIRRAWIWIAM
jgi:hypothetical protein